MNLAATLAGKKTYITAAATVATAVAAAANGQATPLQAGLGILASLLAAFVRAGSKADAAKATIETTAAVVAQLAPAIGAINPAAAKAAGTIGAVAQDVSQLG